MERVFVLVVFGSKHWSGLAAVAPTRASMPSHLVGLFRAFQERIGLFLRNATGRNQALNPFGERPLPFFLTRLHPSLQFILREPRLRKDIGKVFAFGDLGKELVAWNAKEFSLVIHAPEHVEWRVRVREGRSSAIHVLCKRGCACRHPASGNHNGGKKGNE